MTPDPVTGHVRPARPADVPEILAMVRDLAEYERAAHEVETTEAQLTAMLFGGTPEAPGSDATTPSGAPAAYAHVVEHADPDRGTALGAFALWFLNTSTWTGTHGIYLEDLYARPELRGNGYGTRLLQTLARVCRRARLPPPRVGGAGLERAGAGVLPRDRRRAHGRVDRASGGGRRPVRPRRHRAP